MRALLIGMVAIALVSVACSNSSPDVDPVAQPAVADLADRLGVEESIITVASVEEVTWSDGSLGCPEPGMMHTIAGWRIADRARRGWADLRVSLRL
jgi:hypothetical protein